MGSMPDHSCIVTGSAQGIGRAIGEALPAEGADVCLPTSTATKAVEVAASNEEPAGESGGKVMSAAVDVTDRAQAQAMIARTVERHRLSIDLRGSLARS